MKPVNSKEAAMYENEVSSAFEILLEEIETIVDQLNQEGARAFSNSKHQEARALLDKAEKVTRFRGKIKNLQKEWMPLETQITRKTAEEIRRSRRNKSRRLQRGLRTPEEEYRRPILEALEKLGGHAQSNDVLNLVRKSIGNSFNKYDKQLLTSSPSTPRWRNTAQWARNGLVNDGLLSRNSPKGIWEITEAGRKVLAESSEDHKIVDILPAKEKGPKALYYLLKVYQLVESKKCDYNEAVAQITKEEKLKSIHTVYDACTRRIKLNTEQFKALLKDHPKLIEHLVRQYPKQETYIKNTIITD